MTTLVLVLVLWLSVAVLLALAFGRLCTWSQISVEPAAPAQPVDVPSPRVQAVLPRVGAVVSG